MANWLKTIKNIFGRRSNGMRNLTGARDWVDQWGKQRVPNRSQMLHEYSAIVFACANLNADAISNTHLRLYAKLREGQKCLYDSNRLPGGKVKQLQTKIGYQASGRVEELTEHPFLTLLHDPNPYQTGFELLNMTCLYLETTGVAYWNVAYDALGRPSALWLMPPQYTLLQRDPDNGFPGWYEFAGNQYGLDEVIYFSLPDLMNPFLDGRSPVRAAWEELNINDKFSASLEAMLDNQARPDMLISFPDGGPGADEMERLKTQYRQTFGRGGSGGPWFADEKIEATPLVYPTKDLAALKIFEQSKVTICNVFGVPPALLEQKEVSRANMVAAKAMHAETALLPRMKRLEGRLNKFIREHYDNSGRLFVCWDDPTPELSELKMAEVCQGVAGSVYTVNEGRDQLGLEPHPDGYILVGNFNFAQGQAQQELASNGANANQDNQAPADPAATAQPTDAQAAADATGQELQTTAATVLNGLQIQSALAIVEAVANGELPRDSALGMLQTFFNLSPEQAADVMGSVGAGFEPTPAAAPVAPVASAPVAEVDSDDDSDDGATAAEGKSLKKKVRVSGPRSPTNTLKSCKGSCEHILPSNASKS